MQQICLKADLFTGRISDQLATRLVPFGCSGPPDKPACEHTKQQTQN